MQPFGWGSPYGHGFDPTADLGPLKSKPRWWDARAEEALRESVRHWQWAWQTSFLSWFVDNIRGSHQSLAMQYAAAQARHLGLLDGVRHPITSKPCLHCGELFREDGVAASCLTRFGNVDSIDYCNPCMLRVIDHEPTRGDLPVHSERKQIVDWLQLIAEGLQRVPSKSFPSVQEFRAAGYDERLQIVTLCQRRPSVRRVKQLFGAWLAALIAAGLLENGTRRLMRGTQCFARDGHVCFSLGEKTVDDFLTDTGLQHEKEPHYPDSNLRADFRIGNMFVEFLGLKGQSDYDERTAVKTLLCETRGVRLLLIEPKDLASRTTLGRKIARALAS